LTGRDDQDQICQDFGDAVNLTAGELGQWLKSDESKSVGVTSGGQKKSSSGGGESVGHDSGERIVTILGKKKSDLTDDDFAHMRKVTGYVKRHRAQRPEHEDIKDSRWRYSLMNWGHDPLKE
jgi:uncharacterized protein DUF3140